MLHPTYITSRWRGRIPHDRPSRNYKRKCKHMCWPEKDYWPRSVTCFCPLLWLFLHIFCKLKAMPCMLAAVWNWGLHVVRNVAIGPSHSTSSLEARHSITMSLFLVFIALTWLFLFCRHSCLLELSMLLCSISAMIWRNPFQFLELELWVKHIFRLMS